jgi:hypothetical protein
MPYAKASLNIEALVASPPKCCCRSTNSRLRVRVALAKKSASVFRAAHPKLAATSRRTKQ